MLAMKKLNDMHFPNAEFEVFIIDIDGKKIWELAEKDKVFMEMFNDQVIGLTEKYMIKNPYADYKKTRDQKFRSSKQGGILEYYVHLVKEWSWAKQKDPTKKFDDLIDKRGHIWECKTFSKDKIDSLYDRYKNILENKNDYIHGWILGELQMSYMFTRLVRGNKNGVLSFLASEIEKIEGDIPF
jgi:hypothetical protein